MRKDHSWIRTIVSKTTSARKLKGELNSLSSPGSNIVLDLSEWSDVDSRIAAVILEAANRLKKIGGKLAVCGIGNRIRVFFELLGLQRSIAILGDQKALVPNLAA